jgi:hypothetical protein
MKTDQNNETNSSNQLNYYCLESCDSLPVSSEQVRLIKISTDTKQSLSKQNELANNSTIVGMVILSILIWTGIVSWLRVRKINKELRNNNLSINFINNPNQATRNFKSISCNKCKFFDNNSYLKCAVNPSKVLQPEAKECIDYSLRPPKKLFSLDKFQGKNNNFR